MTGVGAAGAEVIAEADDAGWAGGEKKAMVDEMAEMRLRKWRKPKNPTMMITIHVSAEIPPKTHLRNEVELVDVSQTISILWLKWE